jgi:hypothetical protein
MNEMDELIEDMTLDIWRCGFIGSDADADRMWGCMNDDDRNVYRDYARAALAAIHARGDRVVPGVATREMLVETAELENSTAIHNYGGTPTADDYWSVMLSASPYAPEKEG